jgi:hypothetical protein
MSAMAVVRGGRRFPLWLLPLALIACSDGTGPAVPSTLEVVGGDGQQGTVAAALSQAPTVRVLDGRGRPVAGATVRWVVTSGYGTASPGTTTADADGVAATQWTLGTLAGQQELVARVEGTQVERRFTAEARAGAPALLQSAEGHGQMGETGQPLPTPLVVRVVDGYGNGVPDVAVVWEVVAGEGSLAAPTSTTDGSGHASNTWTLGPVIGEQSVTASVGGITRTFSAMAGSATFNLVVQSVHLNQGTQNDTSGVGGVARRPGLLRVLVRATEANQIQADMRVELHVPGRGLLRDTVIPGPAAGVPTDPDFFNINHSFNLVLAEGDVASDLGVVVVLDPDQRVPVVNREDNRLPRGSGIQPLDVAPLAPLRVVLFPIRANGLDSRLNAENVEQFLGSTRRFIPTATIETTVRPTFSTGRDLATGEGWVELLSDLQALRTAENATDQYYHGIVPAVPGTGIVGIAYVPGSPASGFRSALTFDRLPQASDVVAHEVGHNLGRHHAPSPGCPTPANIDPNFPYSGGGVGWPAYDIVAQQFLSAGFRDYMGYCTTVWTSDYTYAGIRAWRLQDPLAQASGATVAGRAATLSPTVRAGTQHGVLVWGRISSTGVTLNPAFTLETRPALPSGRGDYTLRGVAGDGREVFRYSFDGVPVAHAPDPDEAHFSFFVPLDQARAGELARIEVTGPRGRAVQEARPAAAAAVAEVRVEAPTPRELRVRWRPERNPMALVRDPATGRVLALGHTGDLRLDSGSLRPDQVEVLVSDGVVSRRARAR